MYLVMLASRYIFTRGGSTRNIIAIVVKEKLWQKLGACKGREEKDEGGGGYGCWEGREANDEEKKKEEKELAERQSNFRG